MARSSPDAGITGVQQLFEHSADAVFAIDGARRICYANAAFLRLLDKTEGEVLGRPCCNVVCAVDLAARPLCSVDCAIARQAAQRQPVPNLDFVISRPDGERCWVNVGVYPLAASDDHARVYFVLRTVTSHRLVQQLASEMGDAHAVRQLPALTPRETQVLKLAANGLDTADIGRELSIAPQTVRNHFKNIFAKLGARSRAQAVALALRHRLV
jgi:PAS domain S-box-containing protein